MKRLAVLVLSLVLCFSMCIPVWGYTVPQTDGEAVADYAYLLEYDEAKALEEKIDIIKTEYSYDILIHTTSANISSDEMLTYVDDFCSQNGYCEDDTPCGIVLTYFESAGEYSINEVGTGIRVIDNDSIVDIIDAFDADLSKDGHYKAFDKFLDNVYSYLNSSPDAESLKKSDEESSFFSLETYDPLSLYVEGLNPDRGQSVVDDADILEYFEEQLLAVKIKNIIEKYSYDVVIHTTLTVGEAESVESYVDDFYDYNGYGYGNDDDGMAFALVMDSRDYYTSTHGKGIDVFNDNAIAYLGDTIVNDLSAGEYYEAFSAYLDEVDRYLYEYENDIVGDEYYEYYGYEDSDSSPSVKDIIVKELGILLFAVAVAGFVVFMMKKRMNTAVAKREANAYIKQGSVNIGYQKDTFLYDTVTKTAKPKNNSSSSGGSSRSRPSGGGGFSGGSRTHTSSSGRTHGGGGGKF